MLVSTLESLYCKDCVAIVTQLAALGIAVAPMLAFPGTEQNFAAD